MPYILANDRPKFENLVKAMRLSKIETAGELNYLITHLVHSYLDQRTKSYQSFNDVMGAQVGALLELYRKEIAPYEELKIHLNGDVP